MELPLAPLFPLPDTILFPSQILPLQIFEPRYLQMVSDLLDGKGELIIGTVFGADKERLSEVAPVQAVAGLGRLERYEKLSNDRFLVVILGIDRVNVFPTPSSRMYPQAHYDPIASSEKIEESQVERLRELVKAKEEFGGLPDSTGPVQLVDILIMTAEIPVEDKYHFFAIGDIAERAAQVIDAYNQADS